jgi:hypothetical protein
MGERRQRPKPRTAPSAKHRFRCLVRLEFGRVARSRRASRDRLAPRRSCRARFCNSALRVRPCDANGARVCAPDRKDCRSFPLPRCITTPSCAEGGTLDNVALRFARTRLTHKADPLDNHWSSKRLALIRYGLVFQRFCVMIMGPEAIPCSGIGEVTAHNRTSEGQ